MSKKFTARIPPDGNGFQITDARGRSRRVYNMPQKKEHTEPAPHAAGSFHNPEHHHRLMERFEASMYGKPEGNG
jgi:hypothetical protein